MYAIEPIEIGKPVGARAIQPEWELVEGETFKVEEWNESLVLAEDEVSLRSLTEEETAANEEEESLKSLKEDALDAESAKMQEEMVDTGTTPEALLYQAKKTNAA